MRNNNSREDKRAHLIYYLNIIETDSGANFGHLADITPKGIMIVSESPIPVGKEFSFRMQLPNKISERDDVSFRARCLWCKKDYNPDFYISGYKIVDVASQEIEKITDLIKSYGFKSL